MRLWVPCVDARRCFDIFSIPSWTERTNSTSRIPTGEISTLCGFWRIHLIKILIGATTAHRKQTQVCVVVLSIALSKHTGTALDWHRMLTTHGYLHFRFGECLLICGLESKQHDYVLNSSHCYVSLLTFLAETYKPQFPENQEGMSCVAFFGCLMYKEFVQKCGCLFYIVPRICLLIKLGKIDYIE